MAAELDLSHVPLRLSTPVYRYHQYQGVTNDCAPASLAIAVNALRGERALMGSAVAQEMNRIAVEWRPFPRVTVSRIPNWATFPWGMVRYMTRLGFRACWRPFGTLERLEQNLRADRMTMVIVGEPWRWRGWSYAGWAHVKILFGELPGHGFLFVDPGFPRSPSPDRLEHHGLFWQAKGEFLRQWRNLLRLYVEVDAKPWD